MFINLVMKTQENLYEHKKHTVGMKQKDGLGTNGA